MQQDETQRGDAESKLEESVVRAPTEAPLDHPAAVLAPDGPSQPRRLVYVPAFRYVFENKDWFVSVILASVCIFIPVMGQVALWGYFYEIVESLYRQPDSQYPKFEFRRLGDYCVRGVWPFVLLQAVQVTLQMLLQLPIQFSLQGLFILAMTNRPAGTIAAAVGVPAILVFLLVLAVGVSVLTTPFLLRAGLTQDVRQVFRGDWIKGYIRRMWVEEILAALFILFASAVLLPLGCLVFCFGFFAVSVVIMIATAHIHWQLYEIYLERGGEPIQLHPLPAEAPPAQVELPRT